MLSEAADAGFIAIQLAYNNRLVINDRTVCNSIKGLNTDNCAGAVRKDKLLGGNTLPATTTSVADSIDKRLKRLVRYLTRKGFDLPINAIKNGKINWPAMNLGGHSQGAGQALYIGKYFGARHVCLLAGSYDVPDNTPPQSTKQITDCNNIPQSPTIPVADWFLDTSARIPLFKVRAIVAENDPFYEKFCLGYQAMSMKENRHWRSFFRKQYVNNDNGLSKVNGHGAAVHDSRFAPLRKKACFTQQYFE